MDEWKIYLWKPQRPMRAIIESHPVPGYEEVCFDERVATFQRILLGSPSRQTKGNCQNVLSKSESLYQGLVLSVFCRIHKLFTKTYILKQLSGSSI